MHVFRKAGRDAYSARSATLPILYLVVLAATPIGTRHSRTYGNSQHNLKNTTSTATLGREKPPMPPAPNHKHGLWLSVTARLRKAIGSLLHSLRGKSFRSGYDRFGEQNAAHKFISG